MEIILFTHSAACCSPAGGHSWTHIFFIIIFYLFMAYTGADRQTRCDAEQSDGMRSLSADKCISDKRAAERLMSLRILTEWVSFFFFSKKEKKRKEKERKRQNILRCHCASGNITVLLPKLRCWKYWLCWTTGKDCVEICGATFSHGAGSWSSLISLTP